MRSKLQEAAPRMPNSRVSLLTAISLSIYNIIVPLGFSQPTGCTVVRAVSVGIDQYLRCSALLSNVVIISHTKSFLHHNHLYFQVFSPISTQKWKHLISTIESVICL